MSSDHADTENVTELFTSTGLPPVTETLLPFTASQIRRGLKASQILSHFRVNGEFIVHGISATDEEIDEITDEQLDIIQAIMEYEKSERDNAEIHESLKHVFEKFETDFVEKQAKHDAWVEAHDKVVKSSD